MMDTLHDNEIDYSPGVTVASIPPECAGLRVDAALARLYPEHSRSRLQQWMKEGRIKLNDDAVDPKRKVWGGESVTLEAAPLPEETAAEPEDIPLNVVFEDAHIMVIDKPAGLVVHPGNGNWTGTLLNALLHHAPALRELPRAGIVHRLDKDTTGLLVVAKTLTAQTALVRQLQARSVKRHYLALVVGRPNPSGLIDAPIGRHPTQRTKMAVVAQGREARTHYELKQHFAKASLVECRLETGRTHQIRVHMAKIGHPLVGDPVYGKSVIGDPVLDAFKRQALHAWRLALIHPESGEEMAWETALPADFADLLASLRP